MSDIEKYDFLIEQNRDLNKYIGIQKKIIKKLKEENEKYKKFIDLIKYCNDSCPLINNCSNCRLKEIDIECYKCWLEWIKS